MSRKEQVGETGGEDIARWRLGAGAARSRAARDSVNDPLRPAMAGGRLEIMVGFVVLLMLVTGLWLVIALSANLPPVVIAIGIAILNLALSTAEQRILRRRLQRNRAAG